MVSRDQSSTSSSGSLASFSSGGLLGAVNQCQALLADDKELRDALKFPQIIIVGEQSSGKSSVLCSLLGIDLFPHRSGTCTRATIVLQMNNVSQSGLEALAAEHGLETGGEARFAISGSGKTRWVPSPAEASELIDSTTAELLAAEKGEDVGIVQKSQITVACYSPRCENLTVVDLPGLVDERLSPKMSKAIERLVLHEAQKPTSIILAVHPVTQDREASKGLGISKTCDPEGVRTVCVVTKLDLEPSRLPTVFSQCAALRHGCYGMLCRSDKDRETISLPAFLDREERRRLDQLAPPELSERCGVQRLRSCLVRALGGMLSQELPAITEKITRSIEGAKADLAVLGPAPREDPVSVSALVSKIVHKFLGEFAGGIEGTPTLSGNSHSVGYELRAYFEDKLAPALKEVAQLGTTRTEAVLQCLRRSTGFYQGMAPSITVLRMLFDVATSNFDRVKIPLQRALHEASAIIHKSLVDTLYSTSGVGQTEPGESQEDEVVEWITSRLGAIVRQLGDLVPKMVGVFLVDELKLELNPEQLLKDKAQEEVVELVREDEGKHAQRERLGQKLHSMAKCIEILTSY
eukprot:m51a1_g7409 putative dnm1p (579) ;mRNA; f:198515-200492